ncbi:hypothetical protein EXU30_07960 [Shewanella maritima]|uniref:EAL domain-containing protein n=1 Tax=Shewanella maritima TaxID=2520507 RepID=A0A411PGE9_9GAMM|nr:hypothetical protein [Shewanella maritima]QBF82633.1 hypothetical protein EXU30_07960 [Shewanella maritima]
MSKFDNCQLLNGIFTNQALHLGQDLLNASVDYKLEEIYGQDGVVGYEVLIDNVGSVKDRLFNAGLLMDRLFYFIEQSACFYKYDMEGKSLFVNFEVYELCDSKLLKKIVEFSELLKVRGMELVCEITERNLCAPCRVYEQGLLFLKKHLVHLCADDYDWAQGDYRSRDLLRLFNSVKLQVPKDEICLESFSKNLHWNDFSNKFDFIVFERVETVNQLHSLKSLNIDHSYYQGYLFESNRIKLSPLG